MPQWDFLCCLEVDFDTWTNVFQNPYQHVKKEVLSSRSRQISFKMTTSLSTFIVNKNHNQPKTCVDWQFLVYLILRHSTFVSKLLQVLAWLHSLKQTVRPWKSARPQKETIVFKPPIFRGELLVSGKKTILILCFPCCQARHPRVWLSPCPSWCPLHSEEHALHLLHSPQTHGICSVAVGVWEGATSEVGPGRLA